MVALGADVAVEPGAGTKWILDADYAAAGATVTADAVNGLPAHAGDARADQTLAAVEPEGEAQDRRQGHQHGRSVAFQMAVVTITRQCSRRFYG
jgi:NAD/NADP transhydrogenase alpha subunit